MAEALATKWRPKDFNDVCSQKSVITILERQLSLKEFKNCYLFTGPSGCGKTTLGRILAKRMNNFQGEPIEIDAASNNGVENIREIIQSANERAIDAEYKIFIIDECHMMTTQAWNAFLKCIEEPPRYTIFIFCTTDPQKIPATILNRVQRFNLTKVNTEEIKNRLAFVCQQEGFTDYDEAINYISKICNGGMRDALAMLDKCASFSTSLKIENVLSALGNYSYQTYFKLTNAIIDKEEGTIINVIEELNDNGNDLKLFIDCYLDFLLDLNKYCLFKNMSCLKIPTSMEQDIKFATGIENNTVYFNKLVDKVLDLKNMIRYDSSIKTTIEVVLLRLSRGV